MMAVELPERYQALEMLSYRLEIFGRRFAFERQSSRREA
jgi:hypothetical protein